MAIYYVDYVSGSDSANGTSAGSAWQTQSKVALSTFAAGDVILFKAGQTHYPAASAQNLTVGAAGAAGNPIIIGAYGTGDRPIIVVSNAPITPWTLFSGSTYYNNYSGTSFTGLWEDGYGLRHGDSIDGLNPGEYYWNNSSNAYFSLDAGKSVGIYYCPTGGVASDHVVTKCGGTNGVALNDRSYVELHDLHIKGAYQGVYGSAISGTLSGIRLVNLFVSECRAALQLEGRGSYNCDGMVITGCSTFDCGNGNGLESFGNTSVEYTKQLNFQYTNNKHWNINAADKWDRFGTALDHEGMAVMNPLGGIISGNTFSGGRSNGGAVVIWVHATTASMGNLFISRNRFDSWQGRPLSLGSTAVVSTEGNVLVDSNLITGGAGVDCAVKFNTTAGTAGCTFTKNTIVGNWTNTVWVAGNCTGWNYQDNVCVRTDSAQHLKIDAGGSLTFAGKNYWQGGGTTGIGASDVAGDPMLAATYRPLPNSPLLGAGTPISGINRDFDGKWRRNPPAIGAFDQATFRHS